MTLAALIILGVIACGLIALTGSVLAQAREHADESMRHIRVLIASHAEQTERLITAAISPDALTSLQRLEVTTRGALARTEVAARIGDAARDRRFGAQEIDREFEDISGGMG